MKSTGGQFVILLAVTVLIILGARWYGSENSSQTAQTNPEATMSTNSENTHVVISTKKGEIEIELFAGDAPKTVNNFVELTKKGYYNGVTFHRVEKTPKPFVIQGGDPSGDGSGGSSIYGDTFEDELNPDTESYKRGYKRGVVAMANRGPNTNGSQFFIMLADTNLPKNYTMFGQVVRGMEVVDNIVVGDVMDTVAVK